MPTTQQIVFLQRSGKFKISDDLQQFGFDERKGQYYVRFHQGEKVLHYNPDKVDVAKFSRQLEPPMRVRRKGDGEVHLSEAIRKIQIGSDKWSADSSLMYNLDVVIAVGYRVNSYEATQFRIWATSDLNLLSVSFMDLAESRARRRILMHMQDWVDYLKTFLNGQDLEVLQNAGTVSHDEALEKANSEYDKYLKIQDQKYLSDFDLFLSESDNLNHDKH